MTDFEKLISIIKDKVEYESSNDLDYYKEIVPNSDLDTSIIIGNTITIEKSGLYQGRRLGYGGFTTEWFFDKGGNFIGVANWE